MAENDKIYTKISCVVHTFRRKKSEKYVRAGGKRKNKHTFGRKKSEKYVFELREVDLVNK